VGSIDICLEYLTAVILWVMYIWQDQLIV